MKVRVDPEICAGFGICVGVSPEVFQIREEGYAIVLVGEVAPEDEDMVRRAASQCPSGAIIIEDAG